MKKNKKQSLLWQVEGATLAGTSYLFGTMHIKNKMAFKKREVVYEKILSCEAFATEFNLDEISQHRNPTVFLMPSGQTLDDFIPPKKIAKLRRILKKVAGIDLAYLKHLQPLVITNLIDEVILSTDMPLSLDAHLWAFAQKANIKTIGIETYKEQINILKRIPLEYQIEALISIGKNISGHRRNLIRLAEMYEKENLALLYKKARKGGRNLRRILLDDRNIVMANRLIEHFEEHTLLFAVGAGHLAGKNGLLRQLKLRGLKVKPVY